MTLGSGVSYPILVKKELSRLYFVVFVEEVHFQSKKSFHICLGAIN